MRMIDINARNVEADSLRIIESSTIEQPRWPVYKKRNGWAQGRVATLREV